MARGFYPKPGTPAFTRQVRAKRAALGLPDVPLTRDLPMGSILVRELLFAEGGPRTMGTAEFYAALNDLDSSIPFVVSPIPDLTFTEDTGVQTYDSSQHFGGTVDGEWSVPGAPAGVTIDEDGVISVDTEVVG